MLAGLLESAGIATVIEDAGAAGVFPVQGGLGAAAEVLVRPDDAARAREIVASSGVFEGAAGAGEVEEIPESEWSAPPPPEPAPSGEERRAAEAEAEAREALWARRIGPPVARVVGGLLAALALLELLIRRRC